VWQLEQQVTGGDIDDPRDFVNRMFRARHGLLVVRTMSALSAAIYGRMITLARLPTDQLQLVTQNEEIKKISAWAGIFFAPSLIGTVYGMNFTSMPELNWALGYPFALLLMALASVALYALFKRLGWL
jgi:Mg2+ and Co2+ transporter CorA